MLLKIVHLQIDNNNLIASFNNGKKTIYNLKNCEFFDKLKQFGILHQASIDTGGHGVSWNDEFDLSENEIFEKGKIIS